MWNKNLETVISQPVPVQIQNRVRFPQKPMFSIAKDFLNTISIFWGILLIECALLILPTAFKKTVQNARIIQTENREMKTNPRKSETFKPMKSQNKETKRV